MVVPLVLKLLDVLLYTRLEPKPEPELELEPAKPRLQQQQRIRATREQELELKRFSSGSERVLMLTRATSPHGHMPEEPDDAAHRRLWDSNSTRLPVEGREVRVV